MTLISHTYPGSDTDSLVISLSRQRNAMERMEVKRIECISAQEAGGILYRSSKLARDHHSNYLRALINILDLSSLTTSSLLTTMISRQSTVCKNAFRYLSLIRKNASLYYKDETSRDLQSWWGSSPKQYLLSFLPFDARFSKKSPNVRNLSTFRDHTVCSTSCYEDLDSCRNVGFILKAKGLKRSLASKLVDNTDFERSSERHCPPKRVIQHSIRRKDRRVFVVGSERRALTFLNAKQFFSRKFSNPRNDFGYPLYLKPLLELES